MEGGVGMEAEEAGWVGTVQGTTEGVPSVNKVAGGEHIVLLGDPGEQRDGGVEPQGLQTTQWDWEWEGLYPYQEQR